MKDFDELLDSVLREDVAAEPRADLERRVMARVRSDERLARGSVSQYRNRWRRWLFVPAAACLGMIAVWYVADRGMPQPERIASRVSTPALTVDSAIKAGTVESFRNLGGSGRALRNAHLRRDEAAPKVGRHPDILPKRDVFPSPAPVNASLAAVGASDAQAAVRELRSVEAVEALLDLRREQAEPVRVAALQIAPLVIDEDGQQAQ